MRLRVVYYVTYVDRYGMNTIKVYSTLDVLEVDRVLGVIPVLEGY